MARIGLARLANNVNQLAKWANTHHTIPRKFFDLIDDLDRAVESVEQTAIEQGAAWDSHGNGGEKTKKIPRGQR